MAKVLSGPFIGLSINVLYCDSVTPYHLGEECYSSRHIPFCIIAAIVLIVMVFVVLVYALFYYSKNPFEGGCLGYPNRNYVISKGILKITFPLYFALNASLKLEFLFIVFAPALFGTFIFFHRINSLHSYKHKHFYIEYFMEAFLFWFSLNGLLSYYLNGAPSYEEMILLFIFFSSILAAYSTVCIELRFYS